MGADDPGDRRRLMVSEPVPQNLDGGRQPVEDDDQLDYPPRKAAGRSSDRPKGNPGQVD